MRALPLAAALLLLATAPTVHAASSSVELAGPASVNAAKATTVTLVVTLRIDGAVCAGATDIPVRLHVSDVQHVRMATLRIDEVTFEGPTTMDAARAWKGEARVDLLVWAETDVNGSVEVTATYALPSQCIVVNGPASGSATHEIRIDSDTPRTAFDVQMPDLPPPVARAASPTQGGTELSGPIVGAIIGTLVGGAVVAVKRWRARSG